MPAETRRNERALRTAMSSSTTYTIGPFDIRHLLLVDCSESEVKGRAFTEFRIGPDPSTMSLDDRPADGEADAHPTLLGRRKRRKELVQDGRRYPRACIFDADIDHFAGLDDLSLDHEMALFHLLHGFHG